MAIDPTISLRAAQTATPFDPMAAAERGMRLGELMMRPDILQQQLSTARTAERLTEEQIRASRAAQKLTAEQTAEAEQRRLEELRQIGGQKYLAENARKFFDKKTGKLNNEALIDDYLAAGHPPEQLFKFRENANKELTDRLKSKADQVAHAEQRAAAISNIIDRLPRTPEGERQARKIVDYEVDSLRKTVGDEITGQVFQQRFGESIIPGADQPQTVVTPGGGVAIAPPRAISLFDRVRQNIEGTRTEQQRVEEALRKQEISISAGHLQVARDSVRLAQEAASATPEDKDPKSKSSEQTRDTLRNLGVDENLYRGRSKYEIARDSQLQGFFKSILPSAEMREANRLELEAAKTEIAPYEAASASAKNLTQLPTVAGSIAQTAWRNYVTQNADAKRVQAALDAYNLKNKTDYSIPRDGLGAIMALLETERARIGAKGQAAISGAVAPTIPQAVGEMTAKTVQIKRLSDGAIAAIPKENLQNYLRTGLYEKVK